MNGLSDFISNPVIQASFLAFIISQTIKVVLTMITMKKFDFERVMGAGGMPSSHSATVLATSVAVGKTYSLAEPLFGVCIVLSFVVMYDASGVRRAAGKQAKILNSIVHALSLHEKIDYEQKLKELLGHTHLEVFAGAILGIIIGLIVTR